MDKIYHIIYGHSRNYINFAVNRLINNEFGEGREYESLYVSYSKPETGFPAFMDMYSALQRKAHFTNLYEGLLIIDLSEWVGHENEEYFDVLISFFSDYRDTIQPVFIAVMSEQLQYVQDIVNKVEEYFELCEINTCQIKRKDAVLYMKKVQESYNTDISAKNVKMLSVVLDENILDVTVEKISKMIVRDDDLELCKIRNIIEMENKSENKYAIGLLGGM